ncbi:MAG TPA: vitamin K epoxide reductase family protein [Candidatus Limnocylindria bacterium]|nr:vitamin K epoxide reductase family protein [Candidatus Limnocylindria bacterium]
MSALATDRAGHNRRWTGLLVAGLAAAGLLISLYLTVVKLSGGVPLCGPLVGCDTVNTSVYSEFMGVPVAIFGALGSAGVLLGALVWWRSGRRAGLLAAYLIGLASLPVLAYLTYLEIFVIGAICAWCVAYAVTVVAAWLVKIVMLRPSRGRSQAA